MAAAVAAVGSKEPRMVWKTLNGRRAAVVDVVLVVVVVRTETLVAADGCMAAVVVRRVAAESREMRMVAPNGRMVAPEVRRKTVAVGVLRAAAVAVVTVRRCGGQYSLYLGPSCW